MDFTPLTPIGKSATSSSVTQPPPLTQTSGPGMLPRIPQTVTPPKPAAPLVLEKTVKGATKAITASPSPSTTTPVGINPPTLEKVTKAPKEASTAQSPANLRPSWPGQAVLLAKGAATAPTPATAPVTSAPTLEVSKKAVAATTPPVRFESPNGMYIVTCDVHTMGCDSVTGGNGRKLIHGVFSYAEVMKWEGDNIPDKLINRVKKRAYDSFPPFLSAGISLGTAMMEIKRPAYDIAGDLVATIDVKSTDEKHMYRTIHIKRFRQDMFTALPL